MIWSEYADEERRELIEAWRKAKNVAHRLQKLAMGDAFEWSNSDAFRARLLPPAVKELRLLKEEADRLSAKLSEIAGNAEVWIPKGPSK